MTMHPNKDAETVYDVRSHFFRTGADGSFHAYDLPNYYIYFGGIDSTHVIHARQVKVTLFCKTLLLASSSFI